MKKFLILILLVVCSFCASLYAQNKSLYISKTYPQGYFRNPLNIPMDASGTFGELRSTHFHAGDDYRTQQKIGLPLHAAATGFVSRVRVQIGGGGNSVYIDHPNGFTSVYLHMDSFNEVLTQIIRAEQYKQKRFDVDIQVPINQVLLTKGQYIGNAGNTGGSGGPHLHFEIRDTKTQRPLNTQLFGLRFPDNFNPTINSIMLYDLNDEIFNEFTPRKLLTVKSVRSGAYTLTQMGPIAVSGKFGFGISTIDRHRAGGFQNGVYSIELFIDAKPVSTVVFEELDFNATRSVHSYIDYPYWKRSKVKMQKSFRDPGNPLDIFKGMKGRGVIELSENKVYDVKYVVKDVAGNCSELNFKVQNSVKGNDFLVTKTAGRFAYDEVNNFATQKIKVDMPVGVLYDDLDFVYKEKSALAQGYSEVHQVHNSLIPLFNPYLLSIRPSNLPKHLESKALIASLENGAEGGGFDNGWVTVSTRTFGNFYVAVDTISPAIVARNLTAGKNISAQKRVDFTISDNYSGIQSFNGYIDGQWVLMEYDSKNRHVWHRFDRNLSKGTHSFKLVVVDWKDNERIYETNFVF